MKNTRARTKDNSAKISKRPSRIFQDEVVPDNLRESYRLVI